MSSPPVSRASSPSLESVSDFSDVEPTSPESANQDVPVDVVVPDAESGAVDESTAALESCEDSGDGSAPCTGPSDEKVDTDLTAANEEALGAKHERYFFTPDFLTFLVRLSQIHNEVFVFTASIRWKGPRTVFTVPSSLDSLRIGRRKSRALSAMTVSSV